MLTRLRVQGFKSLLDVEIFFGPFTCFIGPNAAGKSNIFDAIRFLSLLAKHPIMDAASQLRASGGRPATPQTLFTLFGDFVAPQIRLEADLLIEREVIDDYSVTAEATKSPLRYEIAFRLDTTKRPHRIELIHESLSPIPKDDPTRMLGFENSSKFKASCQFGQRTVSFISTELQNNEPIVALHQDKRSGRLRKFPAKGALGTTLQGINSSEYPTALAARKEMLSWQTLMLEPSAMRSPSSYRDSERIDSRGANLPAAVNRLERSEKEKGQVCAELTNRLAALVEDVRDIRVVDDPKTDTLTLEAKDASGVYHAARSLSDGTLRFLTLCALCIDPLAKGVICLEEPENGIHPERIPAMISMLRDIAVDTKYSVGLDNPLRQVVVNSHSPDVLAVCQPSEAIYVSGVELSRGNSKGQVTETHVPPRSWRIGKPRQLALALGQLQPYLPQGWSSNQLQQWFDFEGGNG